MAGETATNSLIVTKLHRPPVADDHLHRQGLLDRLTQRRYRPLALVSAPAGYGKSTLLSCWLESCDIPAAWVSLDKDDNNLRQFLSYFVAAIQSIFPVTCSETRAMLTATDLPPVSVLARSLINELEQIEKAFILVLDDYHFIQDKSVHAFIDKFLKHPPAAMHLVLATRRDPPLPLASLRAKGQMTEIRVQDLRFSLEEIVIFLQRVTGTSVDQSTAAILEEKTEGWVTGLRLAVLSLRHREDIKNVLIDLPDDNRYVMDYVVAEVLSQQSPDMQEYLLKTSILNRFCAPLCDTVCISNSVSSACEIRGQEFLQLLEKANLFIIPLDDEHQWFRYHHLFQNLLKRRLKQRFKPDEIDELHKLAGDWFAENGWIEEALAHALEGGDTEAATRCVAKNRYDAMSREEWHRLNRWLQILPSDIIKEKPDLLLLKAWVYQRQWRYSEVRRISDQIEDIISIKDMKSTADGIFYGEVQALRCFLHYLNAHGEQSETSARDALNRLPSQYHSIRGIALIVLALSLQMRGDLAQAHRVVYDALQQEDASIVNYKGMLLAALCFTNWIAADLRGLQLTAAQYLKHAQEHNLLESIAVGNYFAGIVHYERNELDLAESALAPVVNQNVIPTVINYIHSAFILSLTYQAQDLTNKATKVIESAADYMLEIGNTTLLEICMAFQAELALRQGRIAEADFWARNYNPEPLIPAARFYTPQLTLARILLAKGTADSQKKAHKLLSRLHDFFISIHSTNVLIDILILQALLHNARGDESEAVKKLMEAITLAKPGSFIRPFLDVGPKVADLLYHLVKQDPDQKYAEQILDAFSIEATGMGLDASDDLNRHRLSLSNRALVGPLTDREIEILLILAKGLSNNKIADRLLISPETVKRHLYNIYQKLKVKNRHEAIVQAKSLRIL